MLIFGIFSFSGTPSHLYIFGMRMLETLRVGKLSKIKIGLHGLKKKENRKQSANVPSVVDLTQSRHPQQTHRSQCLENERLCGVINSQ